MSTDSPESQFEGRLKKTSFLFPLLLFFFVLLLYWKMFSYPYIQDDWANLYFFSSMGHMDLSDYLTNVFIDSDETFYRPLGRLYFELIFRTFGANPIGFRIIDLAMIFLMAILVRAIAFELLQNETLAWFSGAWYVFSCTVLMDPLMWMAGMYDLAGILFFLLSLLLFMKKKRWASAWCYLLAILFKEGPVVLPLVLFLHAFLFQKEGPSGWEKIRLSVRRILPHLLGLLIYLLLRLEAFPAKVDAVEAHAYQIDFWGTHVLMNILKYLVWAVEGFTGLANLNQNRLSVLLLLLIGVAVSFAVWRSIGTNRSNRRLVSLKVAEKSRLLLFLCSWGILCILPVLFLRNHAYRYYMIYSFPALILICSFLADLFFSFYGRRTAILSVALFLIYFSNLVTFYGFLGKGLQAPVLSGSNALVQRGETVQLMLGYVRQAWKNPPEKTVFIFDGVVPRTGQYRGIDPAAFRGKYFLRYMFRDPSIEVIDLRGGFSEDSKAMKRAKNLNSENTVVLGLKEGRVHRYTLENVYDRNSAFYSDRKLPSRE